MSKNIRHWEEWDEIEDDFDYILAEWWSDVYDGLHQDKVDELIEEGYNYHEEN